MSRRRPITILARAQTPPPSSVPPEITVLAQLVAGLDWANPEAVGMEGIRRIEFLIELGVLSNAEGDALARSLVAGESLQTAIVSAFCSHTVSPYDVAHRLVRARPELRSRQ